MVEVFDLSKGDTVSAYRRETRPAPVVITMSEAEEIMKEEPAAPAPTPEPTAPAAEPAPAPEPKPAMLPKTGSSLPSLLVLGLASLGLGLSLRAARRRV